jgi:hypothetical protein
MTQTTALTVTNGAPVAMTLAGVGRVSDPITAGPLMGQSRSMVETIKATVAKGAPDDQLVLMLATAAKLNLSPMLKEIWCVNMGGQWMIAPSRDGYLRAARRHPEFDQLLSGVVRDGDVYEFDGPNNRVTHRRQGMAAKPGQILGAWAIAVFKGGKRHAVEVYWADCARCTPIWQQHGAKMIEKCAQTKALKQALGLSDVYTQDLTTHITEAEAQDTALLAPPADAEYFEGFPVGSTLIEGSRTIDTVTGEIIDSMPVHEMPADGPAPGTHGTPEWAEANRRLRAIASKAGTQHGVTGQALADRMHDLLDGSSTARTARELHTLADDLDADPARIVPTPADGDELPEGLDDDVVEGEVV